MNKIFINSNQNIRLIWRFLIFIFTVFVINTPLQIGIRKVFEPSLMRGNLSGVIIFISIITSLFVVIKYIDKSSFSKYGLRLNGSWYSEFGIGALIALFQLSLFFVIIYITGNLVVEDTFVTNSTEYSFTQGLVSEIIRNLAGSISEEIIFRSFLFYIAYEALNRKFENKYKNALIACVIISPFFGLAHLANDGATFYSSLNLGLDALMICLPFLITGRLGMSIGMHFSWNITQTILFGFANSGHIPKASILNSVMPDNILTGGEFGPEGSILLLALDIIAVILILYWMRIKRYKSLVNSSIIMNI